jgi:hypothetical protein
MMCLLEQIPTGMNLSLESSDDGRIRVLPPNQPISKLHG